jgi:hypothetical protein
MTSTPMASNVCHGNKLRHLQDVERVAPKLWAHQSLVASWLLADPLPEPSESFESKETGFPGHFEGLSQLLLLSPHLPGGSDDVEEARLVVADPRLCHTSV